MRLSVLLVLVAAVLTGCKDGLATPERFGTIQGQVVSFETGAPIVGAGITTSPATGSITTDEEGSFTLDEVLVGTYTITATRSGFDPNTVTVAVRDGRVTPAALFLRTDDDDDTSTDVMFGAEVLGFTNEVFSSDSSFVTVEYRALNNGDVNIGDYEIYFRVDTDRGPFYQEVSGAALSPGERDVATFRKRLIGATADSVVIEDTVASESTGS